MTPVCYSYFPGFDYLLANASSFNVRVVNCSFSANTVFDLNDPVNIATKMLTDAGVSVVFSSGNTGPGADSLNPYSVAPWVISVGATDNLGKLAKFLFTWRLWKSAISTDLGRSGRQHRQFAAFDGRVSDFGRRGG